MRVLVMGGTQFNGLALVRELARHGHEVTTFNRGKSEAVLPHGVRRLYGDRHDTEQLLNVLKREDFDCVQDISAYDLADVRPLFEAFQGRIGHYIFAGSTVIYADTRILPIRETHPIDLGSRQGDYGKSKIEVERWLFEQHRAHGFPATVMSFSMVFGPHNHQIEREQRMFKRLLDGRPVLVPGDGTTLGQIGHVDDEAKALRMAMLNSKTFGKRYNLTGKDYYTDEGYIDTFAEILDVLPAKVHIPASLMDDIWTDRVSLSGATQRLGEPRTYATTLPVAESNRRFAQSLIQRLNPQLHHWNHNTVFSIDALREDTGWEPDYTFASAVEQTYDWFRREGLDKVRQYDWTFEDQLLEMVRNS